MTSKQTEQIVRLDPISTSGSTSLMYTLSLNGQEHVLTMDVGSNPYSFISDSSLIQTNDRRTTVFPYDRGEPISIYEEVDIEEWKKALEYDESKINGLLHEILVDFNIGATDENIKWLKRQVDDLILSYESSYKINLPNATRSMLAKLVIRMAYDKLCINSSL